MIIIDLSCEHGHHFEAWFASNESFNEQLARSLVNCPNCGTTAVDRVPSAVHIGHTRSISRSQPELAADQSLAVYHEFVAALLSSSEDTGTNFAAEVRKIHKQEAPARAIHGQSSNEEFEALRDEGIEVWRLPVMDKDKLN